MVYRNKILTFISIIGLTLATGCFGGSGDSSDGSNSLFNTSTGQEINLSGSYTTSDLSSATKAVIGNFTSITLTQSGNTMEGVDNLGNVYKGGISMTNNEDASGSTFTIAATSSSGVVINITAAYDPEEIDFVPASSTTDKERYWNAAGTEQYEDTTVTTITAKTTSYKTWSGQMILSSGSPSTLTLRGDIVITGGAITTTVSTVKIS